MSASEQIVFGIAARLGRFAHEVQALSAREVDAWVRYFQACEAARGPDADALDLRSLTPEQRRAIFPGR
jgi:hypothetical protein